MSRPHRLLWVLLLVVAVAAAVLSFSALRDLATACGFSGRLAWLLPVVVDTGAAAGSLVWLGGHVAEAARRFARALALVLLGSSVAANALGHGLAAYQARPAWWVVVLVSAVAPAVLGAVVHLAVLVGRVTRPDTAVGEESMDDQDEDDAFPDLALVDDHGVSRLWDEAPAADSSDRADRLIAEGAGRRRLARELEISEHAARELLAERRNGQAVAR